MNTYTQLTQEEDYQIYALKQTGRNQSEIVAVLGRYAPIVRWEPGRTQEEPEIVEQMVP